MINNLPELVNTTGEYTGNASANRAIAHGLGRTPVSVLIINGVYQNLRIAYSNGDWRVHRPSDNTQQPVTAPNSTYFYVGNAADYDISGNANLLVYNWVAT